jgi:hypothetical protein
MRNIHSGDLENDNFNSLLNKFDGCKTKSDWEALIAEATQREPLTFRQREAVIARCKNSIDGTYGSTKRIEHMNHTKTS